MGFSTLKIEILFIWKIFYTDTNKSNWEEHYYLCSECTIHKFRWNISPNRNKSHCCYDYNSQNSEPSEEVFKSFRIHFFVIKQNKTEIIIHTNKNKSNIIELF